jgi:hypothetical protein
VRYDRGGGGGTRRWLTGLGPRARYGSPNPTWFIPTVSQQDGDSISLTFKRWRAAWRADGDDFLRKNSADDAGLL